MICGSAKHSDIFEISNRLVDPIFQVHLNMCAHVQDMKFLRINQTRGLSTDNANTNANTDDDYAWPNTRRAIHDYKALGHLWANETYNVMNSDWGSASRADDSSEVVASVCCVLFPADSPSSSLPVRLKSCLILKPVKFYKHAVTCRIWETQKCNGLTLSILNLWLK